MQRFIFMPKQIDADYSQQFIFPPSLEDLVSGEHPARFIREFVDSLDLEGMGFKVREAEEGRPSYAAPLLLKILLYCLFMKITSKRSMEKACLDNIGLLWLAGMHAPDHNTIWRFYHNNRALIMKIFEESIKCAAKLEMIGLALQALDGTKIVADVCRSRALRKEDLDYIITHLDELVVERMKKVEGEMEEEPHASIKLPLRYRGKDYLKSLIRSTLEKDDLLKAPIEEVKQEIKKVLEEKKEELQSKDLSQENQTDKDARMMKTGLSKQYAYNAQAVVDEKSKVIVACDVVQDVSDNHQLTRMIDKVKEQFDRAADVTVADGGYFSGEELQKTDDKHYDVVVPLQNEPKKAEGDENKYHISNFIYDKEKDRYICPEGKALIYSSSRKRKHKSIKPKVYRCVHYRECPFRDQCSSSKKGREIEVSPYTDAIDVQRKKQQIDAYKKMLAKRKAIVEHVFGIIKCIMGFRRWTVRGLENVKAQWYCICTTYNLRKIYQRWLQINKSEPINGGI